MPLSRLLGTSAALVSIMISGCAAVGPAYDPMSLGTQVGTAEGYGSPNFASKCSFAFVGFGVTTTEFQNGACLNYDNAFVFRMVDTNDPSLGNSTVIPHSSIKSVSISRPNLVFMKQFQIRTSTGVAVMIFRNDAYLGYFNERNEQLLSYFSSRDYAVLPDTAIVTYKQTETYNYIFIDSPKKK